MPQSGHAALDYQTPHRDVVLDQAPTALCRQGQPYSKVSLFPDGAVPSAPTEIPEWYTVKPWNILGTPDSQFS